MVLKEAQAPSVAHKRDVVVRLDSITRLARAYNSSLPSVKGSFSSVLTPPRCNVPPPRFFGSDRSQRGEGGSLTIIATALIDTGSRWTTKCSKSFKGTGNLILPESPARRINASPLFPAIDIARS